MQNSLLSNGGIFAKRNDTIGGVYDFSSKRKRLGG